MTRVRAVALAVLLASGCGGPPATPPELESSDAVRDLSGEDAQATGPTHLDPEHPGLLLPEVEYFGLARTFGPPTVRRSDLAVQLQAAWDRAPAQRTPGDLAALRAALVSGMGGVSLLASVPGRTLQVERGPPRPGEGWTDTPLLLRETQLGVWSAVLRAPVGVARPPVVVFLHGHGDTPQDAVEFAVATALVRAGVAVFAPQIRAFMDGSRESQVSWALLERGTSLVAVHVAEVMLALRWLAESNPQLDGRRVALVGHSGGSVPAVLLGWLDDDVRGAAFDMQSLFNAWDNPGIGEEAVPGLHELTDAIYGDGAPHPMLSVRDARTEPTGELVRTVQGWLGAGSR